MMLCKCGLCSVCLSCLYILSKQSYLQIFLPSGSQTNHCSFSIPNVMAIFRWEHHPNGAVECRLARHKLQFWMNSWLLIDDCRSA